MTGRPKHQPNAEGRQLVQLHATIGTPHATIARLLDIDAKTLRKHYRDELDLAMAQANAAVGGALFRKAKAGDTASMIFWMKTRAGWRETNNMELTGKDGGPIRTEEASARELILERLARRSAAAGPEGDTENPE